MTFFDESVARRYDDSSADRFEPGLLGATVDFLAGLAGDGRALEFAVGTGRVALPLSERGIEIHGIDVSTAMFEQLRAKPGHERIAVTIGDMATTRLGRTFRLVYLVYNTISNLLTQDEQVACFENAAAHLEPGGHFLIEVGIPDLRRLPMGESLVPFDVSPDHLGIDEYDVAHQRLTSHHYWFTATDRGSADRGSADRGSEGPATFDSHHRYAWPAEYDLMARIAGLSLVERWSSWQRDPFTSESTAHISVWQKPSSP